MPQKLDLLLEAEKRGLLDDRNKALLAEARRRGLVPDAQPTQSGPLPLGVDEFVSAGRSIVNLLGGPPGKPAPNPELAPPGMAEAMGLPPRVQHAAIATGGAMLAGPLASATGLPIMAAEPLTAAAGELMAQQASGEGGPVDVLLAAGFPLALRGVIRGGVETAKFVGRRLPGAAAGLHERAVAMGRALIQRLRPSDVEGLKLSAKALDDIEVPLSNFRNSAQDIIQESQRLVPSLQPRQATRVIQQLDNIVEATQNQALPLRAVRDNLEEIGAEVGRLRRALSDKTGLVKGATRNYKAYRRIYKSILDDLDALPPDASETLQQLRKTLRNDFAVSDLEFIIERGIDERAIDGLTYLKPRQIRNSWARAKDSQFLRDSFSPADRKVVDEFMDEIIKLPALPRPRGVAAGSAMVMTRSVGAGGLVGAALGPEAGMAAGAIAALAPRVIARAMMTETGRNALVALLRTGQPLTPQALQFLAAVSRQGVSQGVQSISPSNQPGAPSQNMPQIAPLQLQR